MIPLLLGAGVALANPCDLLTDGMNDGAVVASLYDGGLGRAHSPCPRNELGVTGGAYLLADTANFYGHIVAGATLDGRWAVNDRVEVYGSAEAVRYDNVIGALSSDYLGYGHTTVGASGVLWGGDRSVVALNGKLVLPTAFGLYENSWPVGADLGVAWAWAKSERFRAHAQLGGVGSGAITAASAQPRAGAEATGGVEWRFVKPVAVVADVEAGFGYTAPLDHLALGVGFRARLGDRGGLELAGLVPLAGRERALAAAALRGNVRLGKIPDGPAPTPIPAPVVPK